MLPGKHYSESSSPRAQGYESNKALLNSSNQTTLRCFVVVLRRLRTAAADLVSQFVFVVDVVWGSLGRCLWSGASFMSPFSLLGALLQASL